MEVKEVMRPAVIIDKDVDLKKASDIMASKNVSSLMFVQNNKLKGLITKEDLVRNFGKTVTISRIMTKKVITVSPHADVEEAKKVFRVKKISVLPVVEEGKLVGMLTDKDLLEGGKDEGDFLFE